MRIRSLGASIILACSALVSIANGPWAASSSTTASSGSELVALANAVDAMSEDLGTSLDATAAILASGISARVAASVASVVESLRLCLQTTNKALPQIPEDVVLGRADQRAVSTLSEVGSEIRQCAAEVDTALVQLQTSLRSIRAEGEPIPSLDLWPVLMLESDGVRNEYLHDYVLIIDLAGDDTYNNNAAGNLMDLLRGPDNSVSPIKAHAEGCEVIADLGRGKCEAGAAAILDMSGHDVYGKRAQPGVDWVCTDEAMVRRMMTVGAGFAGVGIVRDVEGNDIYTGKTLGVGGSHVFGVGELIDLDGHDQYFAIRNSVGFALAGGFGLLEDRGPGNDLFDYYTPAGGVLSDRGVCDSVPRFIQGAGSLLGVGRLTNEGGHDIYRAYDRSQGFGRDGGFGTFLDSGGNDSYDGMYGRDNDVTINPSLGNQGIFQDTSS